MRPLGLRHRLGGYVETDPPVELALVVEACWRYFAPEGVRPPDHRVLPSIGTSLCLHWGGRGGDPRDARLVVMGPVVAPRTFAPNEGEGMAAVVVRPEWTGAVVGVPGARLQNAVVDAGELLGRSAATLRDRAVASLRGKGSPLGPLLAWVEARLTRVDERAPRLVGVALDRALGRGGVTPVALHRAADSVGVSERHLRRMVRRVTGVGAKSLHRMHRLDRLVQAADRSERPRWSALAVAHGYYDQAHLIRECRALTGETPVDVHRHRRHEHVRFFQDGGAPPP